MPSLSPLAQLIEQDLPSTPAGTSYLDKAQTSLEELKEALTKQLERYLQEDIEGLIQIAYRIDLPEAPFDWALSHGNAPAIAELIITRELQKLAFRQKYSSR